VLSPSAVDPGTFVRSIILSVSQVDLINFLSKTIIPALFTGAICCSQGLRVQTSLTEVPKATKRALALSVRTLFGTSALVSLLTYM
jgi:ABC-type transporter Mla maintaining outer membrane lipid asymmetry permease subunit MlaE